MNREDIIRMAREASNTPIDHHATPDLFGINQIERFAALVASAEREACAKAVETIETYEKIEKACFKFAAKTIRARGQA